MDYIDNPLLPKIQTAKLGLYITISNSLCFFFLKRILGVATYLNLARSTSQNEGDWTGESPEALLFPVANLPLLSEP